VGAPMGASSWSRVLFVLAWAVADKSVPVFTLCIVQCPILLFELHDFSLCLLWQQPDLLQSHVLKTELSLAVMGHGRSQQYKLQNSSQKQYSTVTSTSVRHVFGADRKASWRLMTAETIESDDRPGSPNRLCKVPADSCALVEVTDQYGHEVNFVACSSQGDYRSGCSSKCISVCRLAELLIRGKNRLFVQI
jgi:hypothetical protein